MAVLLFMTGTAVAQNYQKVEKVDMGLPSGLYWADRNVGADAPDMAGGYYCWGETKTRESYGYDEYDERLRELYSLKGLSKLMPADDVATQTCGPDWRMPTRADFQELVDPANTTMTYETEGEKHFLRITSKKNGNSISLPMVGSYYPTYSNTKEACYWSSELLWQDGMGGFLRANKELDPDMNDLLAFSTVCSYGLSVRGVSEVPPTDPETPETPETPEEPAKKGFNMKLWLKDGSHINCSVKEKPQMVYREDGTVFVMINNVVLQYKFGSIWKITYDDLDADAIERVTAGGKPFAFDGRNMTLTAADKDKTVRMLTLDGKTVGDYKVASNSTLTIPLQDLGHGVYLLNIDGVTYKLNVR